ncbi:MAG TPA: HlyD family efflux transporter periplasmic adaptor subunit [Rubrivivax sp.]|nr:HlyD family efflux transporter periplasmic adaptor subunit [Rubrivivax sp.]HPO17759.1 HlyD family efflux transporter periplasmic adaptor subunit [Rubrivivax sp.]
MKQPHLHGPYPTLHPAWRAARRRLAVGLGALALATAVLADAGHDHGDAAPAAAADGPKRLGDGSVFLPKPAQRQLDVRTLPVRAAQLPRAFELAGKVVMDPNAGGRVQAAVAGRLEPGPRGLPEVGQAVRKGEILAWVVPVAGALERSAQQAQLAELRSAKGLADKRAARLRELSDTVPRKDIDAAEAEAASLAERIAALSAGLSGRDALRSPASGVVASSLVLAGQVVEARELVFEVVDPARLRIEALAYDAALAADVESASLALGAQRVPLRFVGASRSLREQALPLLFALDAQAAAAPAGALPALALALGQPVRVVVQSRSRIEGFALPSAALVKSPANQAIVWVKRAPEQFEPRVVGAEPLDATQAAVTRGLASGERVVTQGASLINQVR